MAIKAPSQKAHPAGAKFPANSRISPMNGLAIGSSTPSRRHHSAEPAHKTGDIYIPLGTTERRSGESITDRDGRPIHFWTSRMGRKYRLFGTGPREGGFTFHGFILLKPKRT